MCFPSGALSQQSGGPLPACHTSKATKQSMLGFFLIRPSHYQSVTLIFSTSTEESICQFQPSWHKASLDEKLLSLFNERLYPLQKKVMWKNKHNAVCFTNLSQEHNDPLYLKLCTIFLICDWFEFVQIMSLG